MNRMKRVNWETVLTSIWFAIIVVCCVYSFVSLSRAIEQDMHDKEQKMLKAEIEENNRFSLCHDRGGVYITPHCYKRDLFISLKP